MDEYLIKRVSPQLLEDIRYLYKVAFRSDAKIDEIEKKYSTDKYASIRDIGYIAYDAEGIPAAYYGVFPCNISYLNQIYLCAQSGDTMTHPNHRGKGLFITLAKKTYELAKDNGIEVVFGFPNQNSYPGFASKLNWVFNEKVITYKLQLPTLPILKVVKKLSFLNRIYTGYASFILSFFKTKRENFQNSCITDYSGGIVRNKEYYNYKSYTNNKWIEIDGVGVWIKLDGFLFIGEIEKSTNDFKKTFSKIIQIAFLLGANNIIVHTSKDNYIDTNMRLYYKGTETTHIGYLNLNINPKFNFDNIDFTAADFDTF